VRRRFIAQKYAALIEALYGDREQAEVQAQVMYEDGRIATIRADVRICEVAALEAVGVR
jgi:long-chain acyl-CoA synthetase